MREFLVTKMVCAKCGSTLQLTYDIPKSAGQYAGEPPGAEIVHQLIAIEPCKKCMEPFKNFQAALREFTKQ